MSKNQLNCDIIVWCHHALNILEDVKLHFKCVKMHFGNVSISSSVRAVSKYMCTVINEYRNGLNNFKSILQCLKCQFCQFQFSNPSNYIPSLKSFHFKRARKYI